MGKSVLPAILAIGAVVISGGLVAAGGALAGFSASFATAIGVEAATGALIVRTVVAMGIMAIGSKLLGLDQTGAVANSSILANEASAVTPVPIVYGRRLVGTRRIYLNVSDNNQYLHIVYALAEGEIGRIRKIYFNDELAVDLTAVGAGDAGITSAGGGIDPGDPAIISKFSSSVRMRYRLGTSTQTAISYLTGKFAEWDTNARCKGVALLYLELKFNRDVFNQIPAVTVEINGKKIAKVDDLGTTYSLYTNPSYGDSYGANPADVLYDYLTNPIYGKDIPASEIDIDSFIEAKSYCEETITANFGSTPDSFSRYLINGFLDPSRTVYDNVKIILSSFNAYLVYSNGKYILKVMRPRYGDQTVDANLYQFDESNMLGKTDLQLGNKQVRFNQIKLSYFDRDNDYKSNMIYVSNPTYLARDNDQTLEREMELTMVTDQRQCNYIAALTLNQSRYMSAISFVAPYTALQNEVGDVVAVSSRNLGFDQKQFRIMSMSINQDSTIEITAAEYSDSIYTIDTLPEIVLPGQVTTPAGSSLYSSTTVNPPTSVSATATTINNADGTVSSVINVTFTGATTAAYYEIILYQGPYPVTSGDIIAIYTTTYSPFRIGPLANGDYVVGVRAVNSSGAKSSEVI